jgi:hypothetical protein
MSITRIKSYGISDGAITTNKISGDVSLGVKITSVQIANSSYSIIDDTAVALEGGYLVITGSGFASGCQVIVGANTATSTTFVNSTTIRAQVGAADAGTKTIYVVNTDGGTAIRVNGLTYSATPTWVTGSTLTETAVDEAISIQLNASGATTYQVQTGSTLPTGLSLAANGLLSGAVTGIEEETTYNFTIEAIDDENQESPRSFSITITFGDLYFYATTLLLDGDGANGANNNTFVDSSNNNFAITRNGNTTQGTFSPFSAPDGRWGNYFDGNGDYLTVPDNAAFAFSSGNFTIECWVYMTGAAQQFFVGQWSSPQRSWAFLVKNSGTTLSFVYSTTGSNEVQTDGSISAQVNTWAHFAVVRNGNSLKTYMNGTEIGSRDVTGVTLYDASQAVEIGRNTEDTSSWNLTGYISNVRIVKGTAVYTSNFTPSTSPLTAITNTSLLTCQSNRFKDNSTNNFTITPSGNVSVTSFSPFAPTVSYSAATNGGSGYFDGTGDWLTIPDSDEFILGNNFTIECWVQFTSLSGIQQFVTQRLNTTDCWQFLYNWPTAGNLTFKFADANVVINRAWTPTLGQWYHIAVTRDGNTWYLFSNGTQLGASATNSTSFPNIGAAVAIGALSPAGSELFVGYMSGLRIVKSSLYTSSFTPPTAPLTAISNTTLLCNFTNAGILDYTRKNNLETVGTAQITTSEKKYGTGSILINSTSNAFKTNGVLLPGDFTIEGWFKGLQSGTEDFFILQGINATNGFLIGLTTQEIRWRSNGTSDVAYSISDSNWYHFAIVRNGSATNNVKVYYNGTQVTQGTYTNQILPSAGSLFIGPGAQLTAGFVSTGYLDDFRITAGIARYTSNFTPPTSAHRLR